MFEQAWERISEPEDRVTEIIKWGKEKEQREQRLRTWTETKGTIRHINIHFMGVSEGEEKERSKTIIWRNNLWKPPKFSDRHESLNPRSSMLWVKLYLQARCVGVGTWECDIIWRKNLNRDNQVKMIMVGLNPIWVVSLKGEDLGTETNTEECMWRWKQRLW